MSVDVLRLPAHRLAQLVREREVTPLELVDAHIRAVLRWNPVINAVVANRFDDARTEARAMTEQLARPGRASLPPLFGVPFTVKESLGVRGLPHTAGSVLRRHVVAPCSAPTVDRVIAAGGICLAVTNVPELAMWLETDNRVFGRTSNPYDPTRTSGGSSGGEAAIVAAGASPFGLGTDAGGSIRVPSSFCGIFGHKPSGGLVPTTNHVPGPSPRAARFVAVGPLARSARDLHPILSVIAGPDGVDPGCDGMKLGDPADVRVERLTVHVLSEVKGFTVAPALKAAVARAAAALQARGARVVEAAWPELSQAVAMWGDSLKVTAETTFEHWLGFGGRIGVRRELLKLALGRSIHTFPALAFLAIEKVSSLVDVMKGGYQRANALRVRLAADLGEQGVILAPTFTVSAPRHGEMLRRAGDFALPGIWNILETPATAVPVGLDGTGLPQGVQVVARSGNDAATIACAIALEEALGGWRPPALPV
ncbi:MAG: amidase [Deltaproteobacteria bacterium]|nr:amidase [Deltaproteobacteria bacterium]